MSTSDEIGSLDVRIESAGVKAGVNDLKELVGAAGAAEAAEERLFNQTKETSAAVSAQAASASKTASEMTGLSRSARSVAESEAQATTRIRDMVRQSLQQADALRATAAAATEVSRATRTIGGSGSGSQALSQSFQQQSAELAALDDAMANQAQSLDDIAERRAWLTDVYDRGLLSLDDTNAHLKALDVQEKSVQKSIDGHAREVEKLVAKYDPASVAIKELIADEKRLQEALKSGAVSQQQYAKAMAGINVDRARWQAQADAVDTVDKKLQQLAKSAGLSAKQYQQSMRFLPMQITDVVTSLASGMPAYMVAIQQGGQLRDSFGGIGNAAKAMLSFLTPARLAIGVFAGVAIALAKAFKDAEDENLAFNKAIVMSGNAAGTTAGQLSVMAASIDKVVGTQAKASEVLATLTSTGRVSAENLQEFAILAENLERDVGVPIADTAKHFAELGRSPVEASKRLQQQYGYLTTSVYKQIKALEEQGKLDEAGALAQRTFATAMADRTQQVEQSLGSLQRAGRATKDFFAEMWDSVLGVGREESPQEQLADIRRQIEEASKPKSAGRAGARAVEEDTGHMTRGGYAPSDLERLKSRAATLQKIVDAENAAATAQAEQVKATNDQIANEERLKRITEATASAEAEQAQASIDASRSANQRSLQDEQADNEAATSALEAQRNAQINIDTAFFDKRKALIENSANNRTKQLERDNVLNQRELALISATTDEQLKRTNVESERIRIESSAATQTTALQTKIKDNESEIMRIRNEANTQIQNLSTQQQGVIAQVVRQLQDETEEYRLQAEQGYRAAAAIEELRRQKGLEKSGVKITPEVTAQLTTATTDRDKAKDTSVVADLREELRLMQLGSAERRNETATRMLSSQATAGQVGEIEALLSQQDRAQVFNDQLAEMRQSVGALQSSYVMSYQDMYDEVDRRESEAVKAAEENQAAITRAHQEATDARVLIAKAEQDSRLSAAQTMFGGLSQLMNSHNRKAFEIGKAAAIANATIAAGQAIAQAYATQPWYLGLAQGVAAAATLYSQIDQIRNTEFNSGYMTGGYTGDGAKDEVAGAVHRGEYVFDKTATSRIGVSQLEALRAGTQNTITGRSSAQAANSSAYGSSAGMSVVVNNTHGGAEVETRQLSETEVEVMIAKRIQRDTPKLFARDISNPDSTISRSLGTSTTARRAR